MKIEKAGLPIGVVAKSFGITTQGMRDRVKQPDITEFFSSRAKGKPGRPAIFDDKDFAVAVTVDRLLSLGRDWSEIADQLRSGYREQALPEDAAYVAAATDPSIMLAGRAISAEKDVQTAYASLAQRDALLIQMQNRLIQLEQEKTEIVERMSHEREQAVGKVVAEKEELLREITRIERERASLETELRIRMELKG